MNRTVNCSEKTLKEFIEKFDSFYAMKQHIDIIKKGMPFPDDINKLIRTGDKMMKLLQEIKTTSIQTKN